MGSGHSASDAPPPSCRHCRVAIAAAPIVVRAQGGTTSAFVSCDAKLGSAYVRPARARPSALPSSSSSSNVVHNCATQAAQARHPSNPPTHPSIHPAIQPAIYPTVAGGWNPPACSLFGTPRAGSIDSIGWTYAPAVSISISISISISFSSFSFSFTPLPIRLWIRLMHPRQPRSPTSGQGSLAQTCKHQTYIHTYIHYIHYIHYLHEAAHPPLAQSPDGGAPSSGPADATQLERGGASAINVVHGEARKR